MKLRRVVSIQSRIALRFQNTQLVCALTLRDRLILNGALCEVLQLSLLQLSIRTNLQA